MTSSRLCVLALIATVGFMTQPASLARLQGVYICPPCGCSNDDHVFDKPGVCPICNMRLVEQAA